MKDQQAVLDCSLTKFYRTAERHARAAWAAARSP
jgi:hypothetical protein